MAQILLTRDTGQSPQDAWARVTDWSRHTRFVPLTTGAVSTDGPAGVGTVWVARTALGPVGFDDPMQVVVWRPPNNGAPGVCRLEKQGRVVLGWAELTVEATGPGSRVRWREEISIAGLPRFTDPVTATAARLLFARVLRRILEG